MLLIVLCQDLDIIVFRHADRAAHGGVNQLTHAFGESRVLMLFDVNANQWHGMTPDRMWVSSKYMMVNLYQACILSGRRTAQSRQQRRSQWSEPARDSGVSADINVESEIAIASRLTPTGACSALGI